MTAPKGSQPSWNDMISNIGTWKQGPTRAVNKPLLALMMLARAQRGEPNEFRFEDIDLPLTNALRNFGPPRRVYHPEYPFWYLQNDGFWLIQPTAKGLRQKSAAQPTRRALLDAGVVAVVPDALWSELQKQPALIANLAVQILHAFWPESIHETIAAELDIDLDQLTQLPLTRARDPNFRRVVLRAYERCCAICGFHARLGDALLGLDAAHIHFKVDGGPDVVTNGLLLCSLHHKAFDLGAIGVNNDLHVVVSQDVGGNEPARRQLVEYSGRRILDTQTMSDRPGAAFLRWHQKHVFRGPARPLV